MKKYYQFCNISLGKANSNLISSFGHKGVGCVVQNSGITRCFSSGFTDSQSSGSAKGIDIIPVPGRDLLRVSNMIDGVEVTNRNAIRCNKLHWIISNIMEKFINRKFKGLQKSLTILETCNVETIDFSAVMQSIQRVVSFGGLYESFTLSLFAV